MSKKPREIIERGQPLNDEKLLSDEAKMAIMRLQLDIYKLLERYNQDRPEYINQCDIAIHLPDYAVVWRSTWLATELEQER